jgi:HEAT repeat protein
MHAPGLVTVVVIVLFAFAGPASAQGQAGVVTGLVRDLLGRDFERAHGAAEGLRNYPAFRAQSVPALVQAVRATRAWDRCSADVRDAAARSLAELKAKEAVGPLLDLVRSGTPIAHECFE